MNPAQWAKWVNFLTDAGKDNDTFTAAVIDTKGWDYLELACVFQNVPANFAALKLTECDTSNGSFTDITGLVVGTSLTIAGATSGLPAASGGDDTITLMQVDLTKRKRYLSLVATAGNGSATLTELFGVGRLSRGDAAPVTAAECGASQILRV
jgi:hypothetical protein